MKRTFPAAISARPASTGVLSAFSAAMAITLLAAGGQAAAQDIINGQPTKKDPPGGNGIGTNDVPVTFNGVTRHNLTTTTSFALDGAAGTYNIPVTTYTDINNQAVAGTVINDAIFIPYNAGSGSGNYRRLFEMGGKDVVDGYNRDAGQANQGNTFEAATPNGFDPNLTVGSLVASNGYYQFSLDINEPGQLPTRFLSVDRLRIYVETVTPGIDPNPLPKTVAELGNLAPWSTTWTSARTTASCSTTHWQAAPVRTI